MLPSDRQYPDVTGYCFSDARDVKRSDRERLRLTGMPPFSRGHAPLTMGAHVNMAWIYWGAWGMGGMGAHVIVA